MQIGLCLPHFGRPLETGRLLQVARRADARGLDSLWVTDHVIVPKDVYIIYREEMLDPLAVLPWLAGVTERILLGTSVIILPYRSPLPVAKLLASVDVLSGGRLIFGAGVGWMEGEFAALGVPFNERGSRTDEALELFQKVWTEREPEIDTRRHRLHGLVASPMPLQRPRPPIWIGGASEGAYRRVARFGDGWHSTAATPEAFRQGADAVRRFWTEAGRQGAPVLSLRIPFWLDEIHRPGSDMGYLRGRPAIHGTTRQVVEALREIRRARRDPRGARRLADDIPGDPRDDRRPRARGSAGPRRMMARRRGVRTHARPRAVAFGARARRWRRSSWSRRSRSAPRRPAPRYSWRRARIPSSRSGRSFIRASVGPELGPVTVDVLWSLAVPPTRSALGLEQDLYLLWPAELRGEERRAGDAAAGGVPPQPRLHGDR